MEKVPREMARLADGLKRQTSKLLCWGIVIGILVVSSQFRLAKSSVSEVDFVG